MKKMMPFNDVLEAADKLSLEDQEAQLEILHRRIIKRRRKELAKDIDYKVAMGIGQAVDTTDSHVEAIDLLSNRVSCEPGIALLVAVYSALKKHSALAALLILGDLSIQGNIKPVRSRAEPLQVGMDNGARRALIALENKRNFLDVSADIVERVDPVFYGDPMTAALKVLGIN
ncbi:MAG: hypothetical protein ACRERE_39610 [Candidatus Entotheonellia bacterium]